MRKNISVIDLYSGIGGFSLGFLQYNNIQAGEYVSVKLLADIERSAAFTFKKNYPKIPFWITDLAKATGENILGAAKVKPGELGF